MRKTALLRRPLPEFGMSVAWYGDRRVVVECGDDVIEVIRLRGNGPATASKAMNALRSELHEAATAMG